jgi:hypothetical protein
VALIGRRREHEAVQRLLDRASAGIGGLVVVTGPAGSGKTALCELAVGQARVCGLPVFAVAGTRPAQEMELWAQVLRDAGVARLDLDDPDSSARALALGGPRLLVVDDVDRAGAAAIDFLARLASRLATGSTAVLATSREPLGLALELRLGGLAMQEIAGLMPGLSDAAVNALWLASAGLPGSALELAATLPESVSSVDPVVALGLAAPSRAEFLDLDTGLIRLLEAAVARPADPPVRARLLARLAHELLGDISAGHRRRQLIDEALTLARASGEPAAVAEVLDSSLHALWDPAAATQRLTVAAEIVEQARVAGDGVLERRGLFWRFIALVELGELVQAEAALTAYARASAAAGDAQAEVVVLSRQAALAIVRGRFGEASALIEEVAERGRRAGLVDTDRLIAALTGVLAMHNGDAESLVDTLHMYARRLPGQFYEATAARVMAEVGRTSEAASELDRMLPLVLPGSGPRWLGVMADLANVAAVVGGTGATTALLDALLPYRGRLIVLGGANSIIGPVDHVLGRLALRLGRPDDALSYLDSAATMQASNGLLPGLAHTLAVRAAVRADQHEPDLAAADLHRARSIAEHLGLRLLLHSLNPPADHWRLSRDGSDWILVAGAEAARLRDSRGLHYLRALLAAPGEDIPALDLVAGGAGLRAPDGDPVLDNVARQAYRHRLAEIDAQLDAADREGDVDRASAVQAERAALVHELKRATGLAGRTRAHPGEAERARVNVTRSLWATVERVEAAAPLAGAHLRTSLRTGRSCRYQPAPGGPARWLV